MFLLFARHCGRFCKNNSEQESLTVFKEVVDQCQGFSGGSVMKNLPANAGDARDEVLSLGREDPLEQEMATPSSILAWEIPWTQEPGGLQSVALQRVGHDSMHQSSVRLQAAQREIPNSTVSASTG